MGWERYTLSADGGLVADFDYVDRGRRNHLAATLALGTDGAPAHLDVARVGDSARTVVARVDVTERHAVFTRAVAAGERRGETDLPARAFAIAPTSPIGQHLALVRYWRRTSPRRCR